MTSCTLTEDSVTNTISYTLGNIEIGSSATSRNLTVFGDISATDASFIDISATNIYLPANGTIYKGTEEFQAGGDSVFEGALAVIYLMVMQLVQ